MANLLLNPTHNNHGLPLPGQLVAHGAEIPTQASPELTSSGMELALTVPHLNWLSYP